MCGQSVEATVGRNGCSERVVILSVEAGWRCKTMCEVWCELCEQIPRSDRM